MTTDSYQIRSCLSCGMRYPLVDETIFGTRCPACLGETRVLLHRNLISETACEHPESFHREGTKTASNPLAVLLDNIRSAWNVGSIFRSADGFGFAHAYLCGITPTPDNDAVAKTSLGAENSVPWSYHKDAVKLVRGLKKEGWKVWALEDDDRAVQADRIGNSTQTVLIVGNEVTGVDPGLLDLCDEIFYISMRGGKTSFNVAIAFSIAAYALT